MKIEQELIDTLFNMTNSRIQNYVVPGLTSYMIGGEKSGKVRMFSALRDTVEFVTPHSHRFGFSCLVLGGWVENTIFRQVNDDQPGDYWSIGVMGGGLGKYEVNSKISGVGNFEHESSIYRAGDCYSMTDHQIHSIKFSRDALVLFFEGPEVTTTTRILEPWVNGRIPTFKTEDWMFKRDGESV